MLITIYAKPNINKIGSISAHYELRSKKKLRTDSVIKICLLCEVSIRLKVQKGIKQSIMDRLCSVCWKLFVSVYIMMAMIW
jgi:hypothetical protein